MDKLERFRVREEWQAMILALKRVSDWSWRLRSELQNLNSIGWDGSAEHRLQANKELLGKIEARAMEIKVAWHDFGEFVKLLKQAIEEGERNVRRPNDHLQP